MNKLDKKICLITGAARGIGAAIAQAFKNEGATVIVTDIDVEHGQSTADSFGADFFKLDVSREDDWELTYKQFPQVDVVVNNAGVTGLETGQDNHDPEHTSLRAWRDVHAVNLDGAFLGCKYAIRAMKTSGHGSIINISSRSGMIGIPTAAAYASSKAALRNHTKSVALYCAQNGWNIRCNSIHPAAILTPMWEPMIGDGPDREANMAAIVADTPQKRFGKTEEVAAMAVFLASDDAPYITGAEFTIDGGILAGSIASPSGD